jgi:arsenate reductase (thioredoxin)
VAGTIGRFRTESTMNLARHVLVIALAAVVTGPSIPAGTAIAQETHTSGAVQQVLFMCPHGAAKSVLASAYFERLAKERGLNVRVLSAGTEPDAAVAPAVAAHLQRQGLTTSTTTPRKATADDMAQADLVISLGCDLSGLPAPRGTLVRWDDVPAPSADFAKADEAIRAKVDALVDELVRQAASRRP